MLTNVILTNPETRKE